MQNRKVAIEYNAVASASAMAARLDYDSEASGFTKRETMAKDFMAAILANKSSLGEISLKEIARYAIYSADVLLIALEDYPSVDFGEPAK